MTKPVWDNGIHHIVPDDQIKMSLRPDLKLSNVKTEPFLTKYVAKYSPGGAEVYDGERLIASYGRADHLIVHADYRKQGIGVELAYQWRRRYPTVLFRGNRVMTEAAKRIYDKVHERFEQDGILDPNRE